MPISGHLVVQPSPSSIYRSIVSNPLRGKQVSCSCLEGYSFTGPLATHLVTGPFPPRYSTVGDSTHVDIITNFLFSKRTSQFSQSPIWLLWVSYRAKLQQMSRHGSCSGGPRQARLYNTRNTKQPEIETHLWSECSMWSQVINLHGKFQGSPLFLWFNFYRLSTSN